MRIEPALPEDFAALCALLTDARLPTDGLREHLATVLVARDGATIAGGIALELRDTAALVRSLVVAPDHRRAGLGRRLTEAVLDLGRRAGVTSFYLLTTTASGFFARHFGFRPIARVDVPSTIRQSVEFVSACPATAEAMVLAESPATVIFACVHNAGRSQMAAAFFNQLADLRRARAVSAGTQPADHVHPVVVAVMREVGVDLSRATPRRLTDELAARADLLVTMGCGEHCPVVPALGRADWQLSDPKDQPIATVRVIRDDIERRVLDLVLSRGWSPGAGACR